MGSFFTIVWVILQLLIGYNLILPLLFYIIYLLVPKSAGKKTVAATSPDYAIIVTAYEYTDSLPAVVSSLLQLEYQQYLIYIVADKCDISNLSFPDERVILLRPETTLASNTRSHFYAIRHFRRPHTHLTIIDSDNIVAPDYLTALNHSFAKGFVAVQGERKAKNLDTTYACLDAARDIYYHFYDGQVLFSIGSSATLSGSGMAFTVQLYRDCLEQLDISGAGFDKVLQREIVTRGYRIAFTDLAIVYDEKTSHTDQLVKQRARWINTWFRYFSFGFGLMGKGITRPSWNSFIFGLVLLRPPLFIFLGASVFFCITDLLLGNIAMAFWWGIAFACFVLAFVIPLLRAQTDPRIYKALWKIPVFIFYQVLSLLKVRKANQHSVATRQVHKEGGEVAGSTVKEQI
jgi:cellulose synthase/poly-beta-1,6-N-acetylglucosamine synthase-like glycosyltransferase